MENIILGNRYELLEKIAEGGMSTIYKAYCHTLNRTVAVKVLKSEFSKDEEFLIKFNNEAKAAASLNHANIISIYDVCQDKDVAYIVMEYIEGINLKQLINKRGEFSEKEALNIIRQICFALKEAHKNKIVHRDIKPHNIMINKDNIIKVGDFGIAKATTSATITTVGGVIGSVHYFSPEQARGGYMDERSDIYSLGVVLYELLTGKPPYNGDSPINIALQHLHENIQIPEKYKAILSPAIQNMILKMTQKNMDKRYSSVKQIISDIDKIQDGNLNINYFEEDNDDDRTKLIKISAKDLQKEAKKTNKKKKIRLKIVPIIFLAIFVFVAIMSMIFSKKDIFDIISSRNTSIIPDIKGKTLVEAEKELEKNDLMIKVMSEKESQEQEVGTILEQNPEAGVKMRKGEEVSVVIVKEAENTAITPNVQGEEINRAKSIIQMSNLQTSIEYEFSNDVENNIVISQSPNPDTKLKINDIVKLKVSKGKETKQEKVPSFIGMNLEDAKNAIVDFKVGNISYEENTSKNDGVILHQNPKANTMQDVGSEIDFVINKITKTENNNSNTSTNINVQIPISKTITLGLPKGENITVSLFDKSESKTVYSSSISTMENQNIDITISAYLGQTKVYEIYINGNYYSTTGEIVFN